MLELPLERKGLRQFCRAQEGGYPGIGRNSRAEIPIVLLGFHGVPLHHRIRLFAEHSRSRQIEQ